MMLRPNNHRNNIQMDTTQDKTVTKKLLPKTDEKEVTFHPHTFPRESGRHQRNVNPRGKTHSLQKVENRDKRPVQSQQQQQQQHRSLQNVPGQIQPLQCTCKPTNTNPKTTPQQQKGARPKKVPNKEGVVASAASPRRRRRVEGGEKGRRVVQRSTHHKRSTNVYMGCCFRAQRSPEPEFWEDVVFVTPHATPVPSRQGSKHVASTSGGATTPSRLRKSQTLPQQGAPVDAQQAKDDSMKRHTVGHCKGPGVQQGTSSQQTVKFVADPNGEKGSGGKVSIGGANVSTDPELVTIAHVAHIPPSLHSHTQQHSSRTSPEGNIDRMDSQASQSINQGLEDGQGRNVMPVVSSPAVANTTYTFICTIGSCVHSTTGCEQVSSSNGSTDSIVTNSVNAVVGPTCQATLHISTSSDSIDKALTAADENNQPPLSRSDAPELTNNKLQKQSTNLQAAEEAGSAQQMEMADETRSATGGKTAETIGGNVGPEEITETNEDSSGMGEKVCSETQTDLQSFVDILSAVAAMNLQQQQACGVVMSSSEAQQDVTERQPNEQEVHQPHAKTAGTGTDISVSAIAAKFHAANEPAKIPSASLAAAAATCCSSGSKKSHATSTSTSTSFTGPTPVSAAQLAGEQLRTNSSARSPAVVRQQVSGQQVARTQPGKLTTRQSPTQAVRPFIQAATKREHTKVTSVHTSPRTVPAFTHTPAQPVYPQQTPAIQPCAPTRVAPKPSQDMIDSYAKTQVPVSPVNVNVQNEPFNVYRPSGLTVPQETDIDTVLTPIPVTVSEGKPSVDNVVLVKRLSGANTPKLFRKTQESLNSGKRSRPVIKGQERQRLTKSIESLEDVVLDLDLAYEFVRQKNFRSSFIGDIPPPKITETQTIYVDHSFSDVQTLLKHSKQQENVYALPQGKPASFGEDTMLAVKRITDKYNTPQRMALQAKSFESSLQRPNPPLTTPYVPPGPNNGADTPPLPPFPDPSSPTGSPTFPQDPSTPTLRERARLNLFYRAHAAEICICECLAELLVPAGDNKQQMKPSQWKVKETGRPLFVFNTGQGRRRRQLQLVIADPSTAFPLWSDYINYLSEFKPTEVEGLEEREGRITHTLRMSTSLRHQVAVRYQSAAAADDFYQKFQAITADPSDSLWMMSGDKSKQLRGSKHRKAAPEKTAISHPCHFAHVTHVDRNASDAAPEMAVLQHYVPSIVRERIRSRSLSEEPLLE